MLAAGSLNRLLTILKLNNGQDAAGQESTTWAPFITQLWASARTPTGMSAAAERVQGNREVSTFVCSFRVRFRMDITTAMRVQCDLGITYDIREVIPDLKGREFTDLVCESVPA